MLRKVKPIAVISVLSLLSIIAVLGAPSDPSNKFEFIYSWPICSHPLRRSTWCADEDIKKTHREQRVLERLFSSLKKVKHSDIFISSFMMNSFDVMDFLCEQSKGGAKVTVLLDHQHNNASALKYLKEKCSAASHQHATVLGLGSLEPWNLHHSKLMLFENPDDNFVTLIFGTGNSSFQSFNVIFNSWIKIRARKQSNLAKQHICIKRALLAAASNSEFSSIKKKEDYASELTNCRKQLKTLSFTAALKEESIAPIFTLNSEDKPRELILEAIEKVPPGGELLAVTQLFTGKSWANALLSAAKRGVKVRLILDGNTLIATESSHGNSAQFYRKALNNKGIEIRFIETNAAIGQVLHLKFLVLNNKTVITGSGQFSESALTKNYENFYFLTNSEMIKQHRDLFEKLWQVAYVDPDNSRLTK